MFGLPEIPGHRSKTQVAPRACDEKQGPRSAALSPTGCCSRLHSFPLTSAPRKAPNGRPWPPSPCRVDGTPAPGVVPRGCLCQHSGPAAGAGPGTRLPALIIPSCLPAAFLLLRSPVRSASLPCPHPCLVRVPALSTVTTCSVWSVHWLRLCVFPETLSSLPAPSPPPPPVWSFSAAPHLSQATRRPHTREIFVPQAGNWVRSESRGRQFLPESRSLFSGLVSPRRRDVGRAPTSPSWIVA